MIAIIVLFIILILSLTVVRIGAIALELTGLSTDVAAFQAQSAFSGAGFTTSESETIVSHPMRRRIIRTLILVGSAGITSTIATLIVALLEIRSENFAARGGILAIGLFLIYLMARSKLVYRLMKSTITKALSLNQSLKLYDYQEILGISQGYSIIRMLVKMDNWVVGQPLKNLKLHKEGTLILSIQRKTNGQDKIMIPSGETVIAAGDHLTLYGRNDACKCLAERPKGDIGEDAHQKRCALQKKRKEWQETSDTLEKV